MWFMTCTIMHNMEEELVERAQKKLRIEANAGASRLHNTISGAHILF